MRERAEALGHQRRHMRIHRPGQPFAAGGAELAAGHEDDVGRIGQRGQRLARQQVGLDALDALRLQALAQARLAKSARRRSRAGRARRAWPCAPASAPSCRPRPAPGCRPSTRSSVCTSASEGRRQEFLELFEVFDAIGQRHGAIPLVCAVQASTPCSASSVFMRVHRQLRLLQQVGRIGQPEQLGQVLQRARALLAAHHREVLLVAVEPGHEHHAGLVEARGRREDVARQRHRRARGWRGTCRRCPAPVRPARRWRPARWRRRCPAAHRSCRASARCRSRRRRSAPRS